MDIFEMLGLAHVDAHIIRNAGGVVTDDVNRSLVLSQRLLGTREIILLHHTDSRTPTRTCANRSAGCRLTRSSTTTTSVDSSTGWKTDISTRPSPNTRERGRLGTTRLHWPI